MDNKETGLETCWCDRRNLVEICDVTKIIWSVGHYSSRDPSAKAIVRKFSVLLYKSRCLHMHWTWLDICFLLTGSKSDVERFSWRHLAMAGAYTFTITIACQIRTRKNRPGFQILMFCYCVFLVLTLAKWHRVLGTRQSDVRDINRGSLPFSSWRFNFPCRRSLHKAFSWNISRERNPEVQMSSNSVSMHLWYIVSLVLTLPLTRLPYEFFCLPYISHFVSFDNLVLIKSNNLLSCGWY